MAGWLRLPVLCCDQRSLACIQTPRHLALPRVPARLRFDGRHGYGTITYPSKCLVLGSLFGIQPNAWYVCRSASAPHGLSRYEAAFQILHKLRAGRVRPDQDRIGGRSGEHVEIDERWVGGSTRGKGRGVHNMVLVAGAVEVRQRKPGTALDRRKKGRYAERLRMAIAPDRSAKSLRGFVESAVALGTRIITDDGSVTGRGYDHQAVAQRGDPAVADEYLPMIHTVFSNLKSWLNGIHHGVSDKHLQAYLHEFTFRFNRRHYPFNAFRSLLGIAGGANAPTYAELYSGEWSHPTFSG